MPEKIVYLDGRKQKRVFVKCPLSYRVGDMDLTGFTVNASSQGIMLASDVSLEIALAIFKVLDRERNYQTELEVAVEGHTYAIDAEIRHFHFDSSGNEGPYQFRAGLRFPTDELQIRQNE